MATSIETNDVFVARVYCITNHIQYTDKADYHDKDTAGIAHNASNTRQR